VGNTIDVYGRRFKITEFADKFTKENLVQNSEKAFVLVKPDSYINIGKIIDFILHSGSYPGQLKLNKAQMLKLNGKMVQQLLPDQVNRSFFNDIQRYLCSDVVVGLEIVGENSIETVKGICGPENPYNAKNEQPKSLRAVFGKDPIKNAVHCSESSQASEHERNLFFGSSARLDCSSAILSNCSLCLIKPHAFQEGKVGKIIDKILEDGFEISAMQTFFLERNEAEEFFELYKGVHPAFHQMIDQCVSGPMIAVEIRQESVVQSFKRLCGPHDPQKAMAQNPSSIRAQFGHDRVLNAVHCTDLESDAQLEVEFFFVILESRSRNQ